MGGGAPGGGTLPHPAIFFKNPPSKPMSSPWGAPLPLKNEVSPSEPPPPPPIET